MMHHQVNSATVAITLVMPPLPRQALQMSPMFLIYHSVILEAAHSPSSSDASATIDPNPATNSMSVQVRHDLDIGNHVNSVQSITSALRHELLTNAYSPPSDYAFRLDSKGSRRFQHS